MAFLQDFKNRLSTAQAVTPQQKPTVEQAKISPRVIELASQINSWHKTLPLPDRWYPLQLGRIAAQFGASRELTAAALVYGGWKEFRSGATSLWRYK